MSYPRVPPPALMTLTTDPGRGFIRASVKAVTATAEPDGAAPPGTLSVIPSWVIVVGLFMQLRPFKVNADGLRFAPVYERLKPNVSVPPFGAMYAS